MRALQRLSRSRGCVAMAEPRAALSSSPSSSSSSSSMAMLPLQEVVMHPKTPTQSLSFIPPPRWAAELVRRLDRRFPELKPEDSGHAVSNRHCAKYLQAFVHPSFIAPEAASSTMQPLVPLGEALLMQCVTSWLTFTLQDLSDDEWYTLVATLTSDAALKRVLADEWRMADLVLSESSSTLLSRQKSRSTRGLAMWLATGGVELPEPYGATCVKAMLASVYLDKGLVVSTQFCTTHVLPHIAI